MNEVTRETIAAIQSKVEACGYVKAANFFGISHTTLFNIVNREAVSLYAAEKVLDKVGKKIIVVDKEES